MTTGVRDVEDIYELSPLQQGMLVETLLAPGSGVYHEQITFPIAGNVDVTALRDAWQHVADSHPILRTSFHFEDLEKPLQVVHRHAPVPFVVESWAGLAASEQATRLERLLSEDARRGFDLGSPPLMRLRLVRLSRDRLQFAWSFHHALMDGWSVQLVLRDVRAAYAQLVAGRPPPVRATPAYAEYLGWLHRQDLAGAERYWRARLAGFAAATPLHVDGLDPDPPTDETDEPDHRFGEAARELDAGQTGALERLARDRRVTLNTVVQAAWAILLSRYSGEPDVVFGAVVSGRPPELPGVEEMIGLFINTLPVRVEVTPDRSAGDWMADVQRDAADGRRFEFSPLMDVIGWSEVGRGRPLFNTVVVFENYPAAAGVTGAVPGNVRHVERTDLPLTLLVVPGPRMLFKLLYDRTRFDPTTIERLLGHLSVVLAEIAADADRTPDEIPMLTPDERTWLSTRNATATPYHLDWTIAGRFAEWVAERPDAPAFVAGDTSLSYAELDRWSDAIADELEAVGAGRGTVVGLCLERSFAAPAAMLAVLKVGAAFLPLDPGHPPARLAAVAKAANVAAIVTTGPHVGIAGAGPHVLVGRPSDRRPAASRPRLTSSPDDGCYVIFTSGSTGRPKGVEVAHRQVLNRLEWLWEAHPFEESEVTCARTPLGFVDSIWELLGPLLAGVPTVVIGEDEGRDVERLVAILAAHGVTRIWLVPSLLRALLDRHPDLRRRVPALRFWVVSGEPLTLDLRDAFRAALPDATLYNLYGTSEVWDATWHDPERERLDRRHVSIGRPIANVSAHVVDPRGHEVPIGVPGELLVGGAGLARGYLGDPVATAERFVPDPSRPGARRYRTGDRARWLPDGTLEHLGRLDAQVKLRGHRIEPAEIEAVLRAHPGVREAAVTVDPGPDGGRLVAAVAGDAVRQDELRAWSREQLPAVMVPSAIAVVDVLPRTRSGKLDRLRLPVAGDAERAGSEVAVEPRTEAEARLAAMVTDVLGGVRPGVLDDFFVDLGGDSLQATRLVARVRDGFRVELPLRRFFERPTVAALAREVEHADGQPAASAPVSPASRERFRATARGG